jgi:dihydrofolate synthase / folylpolyglutamate synthase
MSQSIDPSYQAALDYLYSYVDYSLVRNFRYNPGQFELGRMHQLLDALGQPHRQYPIIHVAGTKGKGSVSVLCAGALQATGYTTGLYTSPHLEDFTERIQINRLPISQSALVELVEFIKPMIAAIPKLTFFEITTALAFLYFARQGVNAAVIEVGLGGRLDATNACLPIVSVITSLSYDHMAVLGDTLAEIAAEKAGIIKPGVPVVSSPQLPEAMQVLESFAQERRSPLTRVGADLKFSPLQHTLDGQTLRILPPGKDTPLDLRIKLLGNHQVENAAVAYAALQSARQYGLEDIDTASIQEGFQTTSWSGRFEVLQQDPPLILDCAHNQDSASKLRKTLDDYFPGWPVVLVYGASEDKDIQGMLGHFLPIARQVVVVKSFHPRAADPEKLVSLIQEYNTPCIVIPDVADAVFSALELAGKDALVLVTGSIFVVAGARQAWQSKRSLEDS